MGAQMRTRLPLLIVGLLVVILRVGIVLAGGNESDALIARLFQRAKASDDKGLRALESRVKESGSPTVQYAYQISRYLADPDGYARQFVAEFPEDGDGVMRGIYEIEQAKGVDGERLTPRFLYSFDELGKLAEQGQPGAFRKLLMVVVNSDGVVAEFICERVATLFVTHPAESVDALGTLQQAQRKRVYGCFDFTPADTLEAIRKSLGALPAGRHDDISREVLEAIPG